jgi:hypothetical protein
MPDCSEDMIGRYKSNNGIKNHYEIYGKIEIMSVDDDPINQVPRHLQRAHVLVLSLHMNASAPTHDIPNIHTRALFKHYKHKHSTEKAAQVPRIKCSLPNLDANVRVTSRNTRRTGMCFTKPPADDCLIWLQMVIENLLAPYGYVLSICMVSTRCRVRIRIGHARGKARARTKACVHLVCGTQFTLSSGVVSCICKRRVWKRCTCYMSESIYLSLALCSVCVRLGACTRRFRHT